MAYIVTVDRKLVPVTPEQGNKLWKLSQGELEPTAAEEEKLSRIDRIILNSSNPSTPLSYIVAHSGAVVGDYAVAMGKRV
jgi:hypothetical protein